MHQRNAYPILGLLLLVFFLCLYPTGGGLAEGDSPTVTKQGGYLLVSGSETEGLTLVVANGSFAATYDVRAGERYPLSLGAGLYRAELLRSVAARRYICVYRAEFAVTEAESLSSFLLPNRYVPFERGDTIAELVNSLTAGLADEHDRVDALYNYVATTIAYDYEKTAYLTSSYLPDPAATLLEKKGICMDYAALLAALLRQTGIPTRFVIGYVEPGAVYHAWNEVLLDGAWQIRDATLHGEKHAARDYTPTCYY